MPRQSTPSMPSAGSEIRELRKARGLTLKDLQDRTGVSLSYLSAIERGTNKPSLDVLEAVAKALSVDVNWFFPSRRGTGPMERAYIVRAENRRNLNNLYEQSTQEIGYTDSLLSSSIGGLFYMGIAVYAPGAERPDEPDHVHDGEQHGIVIKGELEMTLGDEVIILRAGDSYSFDARIPHHGRNRTGQETILIWGVSPVVIPKTVERETRGDVPVRVDSDVRLRAKRVRQDR
ncbi:MAG: XRE family transcriptional regulator [Pseudomonadota bacterium]